MATLRRQPDPCAAPDERVSWDVLTDRSLTAVRALTPGQRAVLLAIEREVNEAASCGPFDGRNVLRLEGDALAQWHLEREVWMRALLAGDPRIAE